MTSAELRKKFIEFFVKRGHKEIPSASLIPENDPTVLFTTAGMHPLVPYLTGQTHPLGKRLCSIQKCLRTDDIEEVGDLRHFTFFEMLGNWSLGDYFKKEAIEWSFEFLTSKAWLNLDPKRIYISVFEGDKDAPKDQDSIKIWQQVFQKLGIEAKVGERIFAYDKSKNWWGPAGQTGPCGPDTEMFYDTELPHNKRFGQFCHPNCQCGRFVEIWNDVFMEHNKEFDGSFKQLSQRNVDTGMGMERMIVILEFVEKKIKTPDPYLTGLFWLLIDELQRQSGKKYDDYQKEFRVIADHIRAATFMISAGVEPSNKDRGYVLRKLIRRGIFYGKHFLNINNPFSKILSLDVISIYKNEYPELTKNQVLIDKVIEQEEKRFFWTINRGLSEFNKIKFFSGKTAFFLYESYGFPFELSIEEAKKRNLNFDSKKVLKEFNDEFIKHQKLSRTTSQGKFKGGLADNLMQTTKLHTATHLLHESLRRVLGKHVQQVGSNITAERLRFDFTHPRSLSEEELKKVEGLVNEQIKKNLKVTMDIMTLSQAKKKGALAFFGQKYPEKVKVYSVGNFSKEVCGGPHVDFTESLGRFMIKKEESSGAGKRRIYAVVE